MLKKIIKNQEISSTTSIFSVASRISAKIRFFGGLGALLVFAFFPNLLTVVLLRYRIVFLILGGLEIFNSLVLDRVVEERLSEEQSVEPFVAMQLTIDAVVLGISMLLFPKYDFVIFLFYAFGILGSAYSLSKIVPFIIAGIAVGFNFTEWLWVRHFSLFEFVLRNIFLLLAAYYASLMSSTIISGKMYQEKTEELAGELKKLNQSLERKVEGRTREVRESKEELQKIYERTKLSKEELEKTYEETRKRKEELEKLHQLTVGRELKMVELKKKIGELEKKLKEKQA